MTINDSIKRLAAYTAMYANAKVDGIGPKGGVKRVPAANCISILDNGAERRELLHSDLKTLLGLVERFDTVLTQALTLPVWGDVEDELRDVFHSAPSASVEGEPSKHTGLQAVYGNILDRLALKLVQARAKMAGDDDGEEPAVAAEPVVLDRHTARQLAYTSVGKTFNEWTVVANEEGDHGRWESHHRLVIRNEAGEHFAAWYSKGLTEYQDTRPWEEESEAVFEPVQRRVKVVEQVEWVKP